MSLRKAIDAKCKDCIYDPEASWTWRAQIAQCSSVSCPLWPIRTEPRSGPFSDAPRRVEDVTPEWLKAGSGAAFSALARNDQSKAVPMEGLDEDGADGS